MLQQIVTLLLAVALAVSAKHDFIAPFPLSHITLSQGSQFDKAFSLNKQYMQSLDPERLLHTFRLNAGINSTATGIGSICVINRQDSVHCSRYVTNKHLFCTAFTGSWEDPACEVRGQFMGHYLSGGAMMVNYTGQTPPPVLFVSFSPNPP